MSLLRDMPLLLRLARGMPGDGSHAERINRFYAPQADGYDNFRERLLHGREELVARLPVRNGDSVVELGAGTGRNVEYFGAKATSLKITLIDLCAPLLDQARRRFANRSNVSIALANAETFEPHSSVDCVYFCYSLSMMQDWQAALRNALRMLKPGGVLGVVDFYLPSEPTLGARLWHQWFKRDGVYLHGELLPQLCSLTRPLYVAERRARLPYLFGLQAPYCVYIGRK